MNLKQYFLQHWDLNRFQRKTSHNGQSVTWSKYKQLKHCPAFWFFKQYIDKPGIDERWRKEINTYLVEGTHIQLCMEIFFNERLYEDPRYQTIEDQAEKLEELFIDISELCCFNEDKYEEVAIKQGLDPYEYRYTDDAKARYAEFAKKSHNTKYIKQDALLYVFLTNKMIAQVYTDPRQYYNRYETFRKILQGFYDAKINFRKVRAEVDVRYQMPEYQQIGVVDFVYNPNCKDEYWDGSLDTLENDFVVIDGKTGDDKFFVHPGQLQVYEYMLNKCSKNQPIPAKRGFFYWFKGELKLEPFSEEDFKDAKEYLDKLWKSIDELRVDFINNPDLDPLEAVKQHHQIEFDILEQKCRYCPLNRYCVQNQ